MAWLMLLPQLPAHPSSLRVSVWRKLKALGAHGLQHGVWLLPDRPEHASHLQALIKDILAQAGTASLWRAEHLHPHTQSELEAAFNRDRDREYGEIRERCSQFQAEVQRESELEKFEFAELEELEHDVQKLTDWRVRVDQRDWFHASSAAAVALDLQRCEVSLKTFTAEVYRRAGLDGTSTAQGG